MYLESFKLYTTTALGDGSVVTMGAILGVVVTAVYSSPVQDRLKNVQQIPANFGAFAGILATDPSSVRVMLRVVVIAVLCKTS